MILTCALVMLWIRLAEGGQEVPIRQLAAIDVLDEVVSAAAEQGKKLMFVPRGTLEAGWHAPQVIAGLSLLPRIAERCAELSVPIVVPYSQPTIGPLIQDALEQGFQMAGIPEHMREDTVQFFPGYTHTLGILGLIVEEGNQPGGCVYLGSYYHETIIWGEAGSSVGAMQIGGTANVGQLPFMLTVYDYTLLGEELFAAGAYMSKEPRLTGSIRGQDWTKIIAMIFIILAFISASLGYTTFKDIIGM
jgi:hypothetical protein